MPNPRRAPSVDDLVRLLRLKEIARAGWVRSGIGNPETVAAHAWGVVALTAILIPPELDRGRALLYAALHDLPEVLVGDLTPRDSVTREEKSRREAHAIRALCADLPGAEDLVRAWDAYEAGADAEARFVRQIDRLDMALQAFAYTARTGADLREFLDSAEEAIADGALLPLIEELRRRMGSAPARNAGDARSGG